MRFSWLKRAWSTDFTKVRLLGNYILGLSLSIKAILGNGKGTC